MYQTGTGIIFPRWRNPHQIRNMFLLWDVLIGMVVLFLNLGSPYQYPCAQSVPKSRLASAAAGAVGGGAGGEGATPRPATTGVGPIGDVGVETAPSATPAGRQGGLGGGSQVTPAPGVLMSRPGVLVEDTPMGDNASVHRAEAGPQALQASRPAFLLHLSSTTRTCLST
jgi:hypothetical protein